MVTLIYGIKTTSAKPTDFTVGSTSGWYLLSDDEEKELRGESYKVILPVT
jgi:hypothetical protein